MADGATQAVLDEIEAERTRQDRKWGGRHHDDSHQRSDFIRFVRDHTDAARAAVNRGDIDAWRTEMIQVAALCVASVESSDRRMT